MQHRYVQSAVDILTDTFVDTNGTRLTDTWAEGTIDTTAESTWVTRYFQSIFYS